MEDHQTQLGVLHSTKPTPIAQLHPEISDPESRVIDGVVTITWPYSIVTRSIAFTLAEHDARLRREKGQLRVEFHGAAGRALADSGVGGGDEIRLSLDGAHWEEHQARVKVSGTPLGWQVKFTNRLLLSIRREGSQEPDIVDVDSPPEVIRQDSPETLREMSVSPPIESELPNYATPLPRTPLSAFPSKRLASALEPGEYASPAFLKRARVSYGSLFEVGFDIFNEDEVRKDKKKRKSRFSMNATSWRYSSRSPSPEVEQPPDQESEPSADNEAVNAEEIEQATEQSMVIPSRPTMVDQGCQTKELDFSPSTRVQVAAEARSAGMLLQSSPTPGWKHVDLSSELHVPSNLSFDQATSHRHFPQHELESIHHNEAPVHPGRVLGFEMHMDIDPRLQFQNVNAADQHTEYSMIPTGIQPHQDEFHQPQTHESLPWETETSITTYPTIPTHSFAGQPTEIIDNSSPVKRPAVESDEEEDAPGSDHDSRAHSRSQHHQEEPVSDESNESDLEDDGYQYEHGKPAEDRRRSVDADDESTDEESEEDHHYDSRMPEYDEEEDYDEEEEYGYGSYAAHGVHRDGEDEDEEDEEDEDEYESEEDDEDDKPPPRSAPQMPWPIPQLPRPAPQPPKEPIFISLLSDSEDEDEEAPAGDEDQDDAQGALVTDPQGKDDTSEEEESEDEAENEAEDVAMLKAPPSSSSGRSRGLSQLDGCDDEDPIEPAAEEDVTNKTDGTAEVDRMDLVTIDEGHQVPMQTGEGSSEAQLDGGVPLVHDGEEMHAESERGCEPESSVQKIPEDVGEYDGALSNKGSENMTVHDTLKFGPPDTANVDNLSASPHDREAASPQGEQNANYLEVVGSVDLVAGSLPPNASNLPMEMAGIETSTKERTENQSSEESLSKEAALNNADAMEKEPTAHQDVEMADATLDQPANEHEISMGEDHGLTDQGSSDLGLKDMDAPSRIAPSSPPDTQPERTLPDASVETAIVVDGQESAHQLPTPGDTQQDEATNSVQADLQLTQEIEDDLAAEQQLMTEFEEHYSSSPQRVADVRPASSASSPAQPKSTENGQDQTPQKEGRQRPEMIITVQSLRSHCRSHRRSIDSIDELSTDPSVLLAKASPTSLQHCLLGDITPPLPLRAMRAKADQQHEASIALAKASGSPKSEESPGNESSPSTALRVMRRKNHSPDRSALLAQSSPSRSPTRSQANSPKTASPPVALRVARRKVGQLDPSLQLAALSPRSTRQQDTSEVARIASWGSHRSHTPETAASGEGLASPALMSPALVSPSVASSAAEESNASTLKHQLLRSLRTSLPDYLPLKSVRNSLTKTADIMAVATITPAQPHRPKHGPRDYMLELTLTDPSMAIISVSVAHIFRPHLTSLPIIQAGDVVLLRRVQVVSMQGRGFGVRAGDASAWAVFEKGDEEMLPQIKGPPIEIADEEVEYARGLKRWWGLLDEKALTRINKASHNKVSQAVKDDSR